MNCGGLCGSLFALDGRLVSEKKSGVEQGGLSRVRSRRVLFSSEAVFSSRCHFLCLITVVPLLTVPAEAAWGGWHGGVGGWGSGVAISRYPECRDYGYPYYAATIIPLTGGYGYVPSYSYGYDYLNAYGPSVRRRSYTAIRRVRHMRTDRSTVAVSSLGAPTRRVPASSSKTVQASAASAPPKNPWAPMAVPISPSPAAGPPKATTEQAGGAASDWAKTFELRLNKLSPDMSAASALLEQEGFRVDSGNKSATGWFLTAHDTNQRRGSIRLQSDGTKIVLTVAG